MKTKYDGIAITRRSALLAATGALLAADSRRSTFGGVALGIQSRSFKDRPLDEAIAAMSQIGFGTCELSGVHVEPKTPPAGGLRSGGSLFRWTFSRRPAKNSARRGLNRSS